MCSIKYNVPRARVVVLCEDGREHIRCPRCRHDFGLTIEQARKAYPEKSWYRKAHKLSGHAAYKKHLTDAVCVVADDGIDVNVEELFAASTTSKKRQREFIAEVPTTNDVAQVFFFDLLDYVQSLESVPILQNAVSPTYTDESYLA